MVEILITIFILGLIIVGGYFFVRQYGHICG